MFEAQQPGFSSDHDNISLAGAVRFDGTIVVYLTVFPGGDLDQALSEIKQAVTGHNGTKERMRQYLDAVAALEEAREAWNFEREDWNGHGPSIRYDKATVALINALESDLARVTRERDEASRERNETSRLLQMLDDTLQERP